VEGWSFHVCRAEQPGAALLHDLLARTMAVGEQLASHERRVALSAAMELLPLPLVGLRPSDAHISRVESLLSTIDARLSDVRLSAEQLADEHGISRRRLDELFVRALGTSVAACIAQRRLTHAARLLQDPTCSELSVATVAASVGYADASHFARAFRRQFGMTPRAWRARD
jgi:transcriptional regulator GlxA family with amidase domain